MPSPPLLAERRSHKFSIDLLVELRLLLVAEVEGRRGRQTGGKLER